MAKKTKKQADLKIADPAKDEAIRRSTWQVSIPLSQSEMDQRRDLAADLQERKDQREEALESLTAKYKEEKSELDKEIEETGSQIAQYLREIKNKTAEGAYEGDEVLNYERGMVEFWYPNRQTGKLVKERAFNPEEHQRHLFQEKAESIPSTGSDPFETETMQ